MLAAGAAVGEEIGVVLARFSPDAAAEDDDALDHGTPTRKGTASSVQPRQREHHRARAPALGCVGHFQGEAQGERQLQQVAFPDSDSPALSPARTNVVYRSCGT